LRTEAEVILEGEKALESFGKTFSAIMAYENDLKQYNELKWQYERMQNSGADAGSLALNREA
jgi:hypothetical protein